MYGHEFHQDYKYLLVYTKGESQLFIRTYEDKETFKKEFIEMKNNNDYEIRGVYQNLYDSGIISLLI